MFTGAVVGNETEVIPFDMGGLRNLPEGKEPVATDRTKHPPEWVKMRRAEMVRGGYSALHKRGHTADSIARLAEAHGKSVDDVMSDPLNEVAHDYMIAMPDGGAPAVWASSAVSPPNEQVILSRNLDRFLFGEGLTIGEFTGW